MGKVLLDVSMSLDGCVAGPDVGEDAPMGTGGERLHDWMFNGPSRSPASDVDAQMVRALNASAGAVMMGRRTFDVGVGPWGDTPFRAPCFVVTHRPMGDIVKAGGTFAFVPGIGDALERARDAAGARDILVMGADLAGRLLDARLLDEVHVHLVPVLLGDGVRISGLAELERIGLALSPYVTHLHYRVAR
ncbi:MULTISPECIES: dihydrofolate reductase family protein [Actinomadura]|uniref:Dihydrofolate reductase family protein n=1 Tax=Actinomadura yumaensis TaxID=111807 RepID=A0ABW2CYA9_9ACTN|nr:dihydrofolate reductase family protein [Actinomadura sp. J1-007]MWK40223.1 dihydrofolate reductase [Actinomadura sp. J1-007]